MRSPRSEPEGAWLYKEGCWFAAVKPLLLIAALLWARRGKSALNV